MNCSTQIEQLKEALDNADAVVIGAGAGLSTSAGFVYDGERFLRYFSDFESKYSFHDMYSGGFFPYDTIEEYWAYWSRYILINRYMDAPKPVYNDLLRIVESRDYFVLTTNVDHCFQKAGFDKKRLFYTQGDYGLWQCSKPCHQNTYDNKKIVLRMVEEQKDMRVPKELIPLCPKCGATMTMNLRSDERFVEDAGWHTAAKRYAEFIGKHEKDRVLYLELGVGGNTPGVIKIPFWQYAYRNPNAVYACVNLGEPLTHPDISSRSICIDGDIGDVVALLGNVQ